MNQRALAVLAVAFALAHAPFLAPSLEDIDSVNFALGVRDFDVADHRPHPPGYPIYIALGKIFVAASSAWGPAAARSVIEARGLSILALVGAVAAIFAVFAFLQALSGSPTRALAAAGLTASSPLFWYLSVRPMSDVPGLAAAAAALTCLALAWWRQSPDEQGERRLTPERMEASGRMIVLGALLSGIAIGFRSQNAVLTLPFLAGVLFDRIGRGVAGAMLGAAVALFVAASLWAVPLVVASGGMNAYLAALGMQAGEDFAGVEMLYLDLSNVRLAAFGLLRTLIYPWDSLALGGVVVGAAVVGGVALLVKERRALVAVLLIAVPYLAFHLLFHDTSFVRYALPLVPPVAFLAVTGLEFAARRAALPIVAGVALWGVSIAVPTLAGYAAEASPTTRALAAAEATDATTLAMHQTFRRPVQAEDLSGTHLLPAPPRREWLELVRYWREGHTAPVHFMADPSRTDLALIDPKARAQRSDFTWQWTSLSELGGMRPKAVHLYQLPPPGWFAEEGWALTPETAGIARLMGRGPSLGPIGAWVRRRPEPLQVLIGGRHLGAPNDAPVSFVAALDGRDVARWEALPGFFLHQFDVPAGVIAGEGHAFFTVRAISGQQGSVSTAIEQFDVQSSGALMWGYDAGWHEAEYNPAIGMWRWTSERATLRILNARAPVAITLQVETPQRYFDAPVSVRLVAGETILGETNFSHSDVWRVTVDAAALARAHGRVTLETNRTFVPADRSGVRDARRLGLRVFGVNVAYEH